jgi:sarcosine oxidase subunit gamma
MTSMERASMADANAETARLHDRVSVAGPAARPVAILRLGREDAALAAALGEAFGLDWPSTPNTTAHGRAKALWTAPGEWALIDLDPAEAARLAGETLGEGLYHLADVSDGLASFSIDGEGSRDLIAAACSLDLHPRAFPPGACAQTVFAQAAVLIWRVGAGDRFEIMTDATLAGHLSAWFAAVGEPAVR